MENKKNLEVLDVRLAYDAKKISDDDFLMSMKDIKRFKKWFNFYPFIWITSKNSKLFEGAVLQMKGGFVIPIFFNFDIVITEIGHNNINGKISGKFEGIAEIETTTINGVTHFRKTLTVWSENKRAVKSYTRGAKIFHCPYVKWRANKFVKKWASKNT